MDILKTTIERLNELALTTNLFSKLYGICEIDKAVKDKSIAGISHYTSAGQKEQVTNYDNENGTLFWLRRANSSMSLVSVGQRTKSCEDLFQISFALRGVAVVKRDKLPCDNATSSDLIAQAVTKVFIGNEVMLKKSMNARRVTVTPIGYAVDPKEIIKNLNYASVYFDIDVTIQTTKECLPIIC
jgi:hypothetical protein